MKEADVRTFSENLRLELARKGLSALTLAEIITRDIINPRNLPHYDPQSIWGYDDRIYRLANHRIVEPPTPAEVTIIAVALNVPESRLTVSREEVEGENDTLCARIAELEAEVERLRLPEVEYRSSGSWSSKDQEIWKDYNTRKIVVCAGLLSSEQALNLAAVLVSAARGCEG